MFPGCDIESDFAFDWPSTRVLWIGTIPSGQPRPGTLSFESFPIVETSSFIHVGEKLGFICEISKLISLLAEEIVFWVMII